MKRASTIVLTESVNEYERQVKKVEVELEVKIPKEKNSDKPQKNPGIKSALKNNLSVIDEKLSPCNSSQESSKISIKLH
jgi:hypothetical protein